MQSKNKILTFYFVLALFLITFFTTSFQILNNKNHNMVNVIVETKPTSDNDILLKIDNYIYSFPKFNNVLNKTINSKVKNIEILVKENYKNNIKNIVLYNDTKMFFYNDFSNFEKGKEEICFKNNCIKYTKYKFNSEIKTNKHSKYINELSKFDIISKTIENFLNLKITHIFSYLLFFFLIFYFLNNQSDIKFKHGNIILFSLIIFLFITLRLNNINSYIPWGDECYSLVMTKPENSFLELFKDPGNPPFYYIILKIYILIFGYSDFKVRFLSIIFNFLACISLWGFLKHRFNFKLANITLFLLAINYPLIYYSQEIRCYSLQVFLSILIMIYTFKILEKFSKKDYFIYAILLILAINTHYYQSFFIFLNFLFLLFFFIKQKRKKEICFIILANSIALISFLPFYILTAHNQALMNEAFNTLLPKLSYELIRNCILMIFGGILSFIFSNIFIYKIKNTFFKEKVLLYNIYIISGTILLGLILSILIRPMFTQRYLIFLIPFWCIVLGYIFSFEYKNKFMYLFFILWIFLSQNYLQNSITNTRKEYTTSYNLLKISNKIQNNNINLILRPSDSSLLKFNKDLYQKNANYIYIMELIDKSNVENIVLKKIEEIKNKDKKAIILTQFIKPNQDNSKNSKYTCYFNSSLDMCLWKIE